MVKVKFVKKSGNLVSVDMKGHAESTDDGLDMVCAGISMISQTILNGILEILKFPVDYSIEDGFLNFSIKNLSENNIKECQILMETMLLGLKNIEISYSKYINVKVGEV